MYCIERSLKVWHLNSVVMRRDASFVKLLADALRQAASNLQSLKMSRAEGSPDVARLIDELRAAIGHSEAQAENVSA